MFRFRRRYVLWAVSLGVGLALLAVVVPIASSLQGPAERGERVAAVRNLTRGQVTVGTAFEVAPPKGAERDPAVELTGVACPSAGSCVAVGSYTVTARADLAPPVGSTDYTGPTGPSVVSLMRAMAIFEVAGHWQRATPILPPAGVSSHQQEAGWSVWCRAAGDCALVADLISPDSQPYGSVAATATGMLWGRADLVKLPLTTGFKRDGETYLGQLACTGPGDCVAPLEYGSSAVAIEDNGRWEKIVTIAPPRGAAANTSSVRTVACASARSCVAAGGAQVGQRVLPIIAAESNGVWKRAIILPLPEHSAGAWEGSIAAVSCPAANNCTAVGNFGDKDGNGYALLYQETSGVWGGPQILSDPPNALPIRAAGNPGRTHILSLACQSPGNCAVVGQYWREDRDEGAGLVDYEHNGICEAGRQLALPANAGRTGQVPSPIDITATRTGYIAVGEYSTNRQPVTAMILDLPLASPPN